MIRIPYLPVIAFVSGFSLMTFELAAARVLAPSIGSSTYVWTSVIGVIIAALSIGYWAGGVVADKRNQAVDLAWLCLAVAGSIALTLLNYQNVIEGAVRAFADARVQGVYASVMLFAPTSFLIGMLSPYLVKLRVTSLETSGKSFASLSALESIGGITGTFITGFILFGYIGAREAFGVVVGLLLITSWIVAPKWYWQLRLVISGIVVLLCLTTLLSPNNGQIDTPTAHYTIFEAYKGDDPVRGISSSPNGTQSGIYLNHPEDLVFWYTQRLAEIVAEAPSKDSILVLGGGAFTLPQYLATAYPDSRIDVVEIDPKLADIAREQFAYADPQNVNMIFTDARTYINQSTQQYDIILVDVYSDASVPFSLMTQEYGKQIERLLNKKGVVGVNMIASRHGECERLLHTLDAPYRRSMKYAAYKIQSPGSTKSNIIVAYSREPILWDGSLPLNVDNHAAYTDNFAPVERIQQACQSTRL